MTTPETGAATPAQDDVYRLADLYCETKDRIVGLLDDSDAAQWNRPVPACPGWSVRDVVAHLTAVALDLLDGRLTVPPSDADTAEHVRRFDGCDEDELFSIWGGAADRLVQSAATAGLAPPLGAGLGTTARPASLVGHDRAAGDRGGVRGAPGGGRQPVGGGGLSRRIRRRRRSGRGESRASRPSVSPPRRRRGLRGRAQ